MAQAGDSQSHPYNDFGVLPFSLLCWFYFYGEQPQKEEGEVSLF